MRTAGPRGPRHGHDGHHGDQGAVAVDLGLSLGDLELSVDLVVQPGEVVALLGPNGAGKSTLLRCVAGLQRIDRGRIEISGETVDDPSSGVFVDPDRRSVGMLFQDYLLFPHLGVLDNVAFGLRAQGRGRADARGTARSWIDRMDLVAHVHSRPGELSGGQAQRAALARVLACGPGVLLLDEPLAALDATTRSQVRRDLSGHLEEFRGATVIVSHDPIDALALADRVAVLEHGEIVQIGSGVELTQRPRTRYVADLVGVNLLFGLGEHDRVTLVPDGDTAGDPRAARVSAGSGGGAGVWVADRTDGPTLLVIRPRAVALHRRRPDTSARNVWQCTVSGVELMGDHVRVGLDGPVSLTAEVTPQAVSDLGLVAGSEVWASVKATEIDSYPA